MSIIFLSRMYQVPVISPWPPRHKRSRGGRGYRDRHYDDWDRERYNNY